MESIYRRLEAMGYPRSGTDWLRRQRFAVIAILAALSWALAVAVLVGLYMLSLPVVNALGDMATRVLKG